MDTMIGNEIIDAILFVVTTSGIAYRVGVMLAVSVVLGFFLYDEYHVYLKWLLTAMTFLGFNLWMHSLLRSNGVSQWIGQEIFTVFAGLLYGAGIFIGMMLGRRLWAKRKRFNKRIRYIEESLGNTNPFDTKKTS